MATKPFPSNAILTAIALAYSNPDVALIADEVLPLTDTFQEFKWLKYDLAQGYTIPDMKVGRKSYPTEVEFNATEVQDKVVDYALTDFIPNEDLEADNQGVDPRGKATMYLTHLVRLGREIRAANLVFNTNSFVAGNQATLSGTGQWSDTANSDPVAAISDALDVPIYRPNIGVFGQATWTKLRRHPKIVQAIKNTDQGAGMVSRQEFAEFFELQSIHVGAGFVNTAKKGQTATTSRVWGKHAAFIYRDRTAGPQQGVSFGFTAQWGTRLQAGNLVDQKRGYNGGEEIRVGERVKEIVCATDLGYFFQNAVA
jgi:hypothetical protein